MYLFSNVAYKTFLQSHQIKTWNFKFFTYLNKKNKLKMTNRSTEVFLAQLGLEKIISEGVLSQNRGSISK